MGSVLLQDGTRSVHRVGGVLLQGGTRRIHEWAACYCRMDTEHIGRMRENVFAEWAACYCRIEWS